MQTFAIPSRALAAIARNACSNARELDYNGFPLIRILREDERARAHRPEPRLVLSFLGNTKVFNASFAALQLEIAGIRLVTPVERERELG